MVKICRFCGKEFEPIAYGGSRQFCFECVPANLDLNERTIAKRRAAKHQGVLLLGGKCEKCGEQREHILAFHHIDSESKDSTPAKLIANSKFDEFFKEIEKCILLCNNCHGDFHYRESKEGITLEEYLGKPIPTYEKKDIKRSYNYVDHKNDTSSIKDSKCSNCGKPIYSNGKTGLCPECAAKERRVVERPTKEELENILIENQGNFTKVGKIFNVTDNSIRKWCRSYDLPSHSSDYKNR